MPKFRVRFWAGPTRVADYMTRIRAKFHTFTDVMDGTEHVYFTVEARDTDDARIIVKDLLGTSFVRVEAL